MKCSFCNKEIEDNNEYITGGLGDVHICLDCLSNIKELYFNIYNKKDKNTSKTNDNLITPKQIKEELDKYIIGQDEAKKTMAVAIYNHYLRINQNNDIDNSDINIQKSNILLLGPTGTGKTEIARSIAKMLNVPMAITDSTSLTQAGYVGEDIESIITRLLQNCDYDVEKAEHGLIVLDECDKLAKTSNNRSITRDVSGEGVQQGLLKMLEGNQVLVPPQGGRKHPEQKLIKVDTTNILFILSGAFVGLDEIIRERLEDEQRQNSSSAQSIGFSACTNNYNKTDEISDEDIMQYVQPDDIIHFGMIPEIVGRLPVITYTNPLAKQALKHILTEPVNALVKQYKKLFLYYNIQLEFTNNAIDRIAEYAEQLNTGARSLRTCMEKLMQDYMFNGPDIGKDYNKDNLFVLKITKKDVDKELSGFIKIDNKNK